MNHGATVWRHLAAREAICSVALSHSESCDCLICRASGGDEAAMHEAMQALYEMESHGRVGTKESP